MRDIRRQRRASMARVAASTILLAMAVERQAASQARADRMADVEARVQALAGGFSGELGVFARHLGTGDTVGWNADKRFPTASVIKVAVMVEAFDQIAHGTLSPEAAVTVREAAKVGGSGVLRELHDGAEVVVRDLIRLMIVVSDNTATNLLLERVGVAKVNAHMMAYGLTNTKIFRPTFAKKADTEPELEREFGLGVSTPREMAALMGMIASGQAVSEAASKDMRAILEAQQDARMLPRKLPFDSHDIVVANKTGTDEEKLPDATGVRGHVRADVGIVRSGGATYVIAIFARRIKDGSWMADNAGLLAGAEVSRLVFDAFVPQTQR